MVDKTFEAKYYTYMKDTKVSSEVVPFKLSDDPFIDHEVPFSCYVKKLYPKETNRASSSRGSRTAVTYFDSADFGDTCNIDIVMKQSRLF